MQGSCTLLPLHWLGASFLISCLDSYPWVVLLRSFPVPLSPLAGDGKGLLPPTGGCRQASVPQGWQLCVISHAGRQKA